MIDAILQALHAEGVVPSPIAEEYRYYWHNRASMNLLLLPRDKAFPALAAKISPSPSSATSFLNLRSISDRIEPWFRPEPICHVEVDGFCVSVFRSYDIDILGDFKRPLPRKLDIVMTRVSQQLQNLHCSNVSGEVVMSEAPEPTDVFPGLHSALAQLGATEMIGPIEKLWATERGRLAGASIPRSYQHGDAVASNIGLPRGSAEQPMLVDWATYSESDLPLLDILTLCRSVVSNFGVDMYTSDALTKYARAHVREYCVALSIPTELVPAFYPIVVAAYGALRIQESGFVSAGATKAVQEMKEFFERRDDFILNSLKPSPAAGAD